MTNPTPRLPAGYRGIGHETIGSDILAVLKTVLFPQQVLGKELHEHLLTVQAEGWYPIADLLGMMEKIDKAVGRAVLVQMGRKLFMMSHADRVKELAKSAGDIIFGLDDMYHHANRGTDIGGWKVVEFKPGHALVEKRTPHHCAMEEGILAEALRVVEVPATVSQTQCFRQGAPFCTFRFHSAIVDERWMGKHAQLG
jgi:predicted hydrocarbon binding protein